MNFSYIQYVFQNRDNDFLAKMQYKPLTSKFFQLLLASSLYRLIQRLLPFLIFFGLTNTLWAFDNHEILRHNMINAINEMARATGKETGRSVFAPQVMEVMAKVPRHEFVPEHQHPYAYDNRPLPIGHGQTISQPYIVALMTDLLDTKPNEKILEIGTGSGYQAAILSQLVNKIYTIEIVEELGLHTQKRLAKLGYNNIEVKIGDGYEGWEEQAPYDGIIVTAAANNIPPPLIEQLKPGGRMIIPLGEQFFVQHLTIVEKDEQGKIKTRHILPVAFVPFTGKH
jgi:protein-L-isoaspartate(D-aspartate) O-methyltransferase